MHSGCGRVTRCWTELWVPILTLTCASIPRRRLYMSSDQFVYNPYYLVSQSPIQSTLGDARLRNAALSFYMKNGRVSAAGPAASGSVSELCSALGAGAWRDASHDLPFTIRTLCWAPSLVCTPKPVIVAAAFMFTACFVTHLTARSSDGAPPSHR